MMLLAAVNLNRNCCSASDDCTTVNVESKAVAANVVTYAKLVPVRIVIALGMICDASMPVDIPLPDAANRPVLSKPMPMMAPLTPDMLVNDV